MKTRRKHRTCRESTKKQELKTLDRNYFHSQEEIATAMLATWLTERGYTKGWQIDAVWPRIPRQPAFTQDALDAADKLFDGVIFNWLGERSVESILARKKHIDAHLDKVRAQMAAREGITVEQLKAEMEEEEREGRKKRRENFGDDY